MPDTVGIAFAIAPDAAVNIPAEQRKCLMHHSRIWRTREDDSLRIKLQGAPSSSAAMDFVTSGIGAMPYTVFSLP
jgi:hypothetical protein